MGWTRLVRIGVGLVGALLVIGALGALAYGEPLAGLWAFLLGGALIAVAIFEAGRYRPGAHQQERADGLERTGEVFVDPSSGERVRVWFDPVTGERAYRPER